MLDGRDGHHGVELAARETGLDEIAVDEFEAGMRVGIRTQIDAGDPVPQAGQVDGKRRLGAAEVEDSRVRDRREILQHEWDLHHPLDDDQIVVEGHGAVEKPRHAVAGRSTALEIDRQRERGRHHTREHPEQPRRHPASNSSQHQGAGGSSARVPRLTRAAAMIQKIVLTLE